MITWESAKEQIFEMPTGGAAIMRKGPNLLKLARKEHCLALTTQLRNKFKISPCFYRVFPTGEVEYLHPKDGVYPEKVNAGRVGANQNMRRIGENVNPIKVRAAPWPCLFAAPFACAAAAAAALHNFAVARHQCAIWAWGELAALETGSSAAGLLSAERQQVGDDTQEGDCSLTQPSSSSSSPILQRHRSSSPARARWRSKQLASSSSSSSSPNGGPLFPDDPGCSPASLKLSAFTQAGGAARSLGLRGLASLTRQRHLSSSNIFLSSLL